MTLCVMSALYPSVVEEKAITSRPQVSNAKNNAYLLAVVARNLKSIRIPTLIRSQGGNFARVSFADLLAGKPRQQKIVLLPSLICFLQR